MSTDVVFPPSLSALILANLPSDLTITESAYLAHRIDWLLYDYVEKRIPSIVEAILDDMPEPESEASLRFNEWPE